MLNIPSGMEFLRAKKFSLIFSLIVSLAVPLQPTKLLANPQFETSEESGNTSVVVQQQSSQVAQEIEVELAAVIVQDYGLPVIIRTKKGHEFSFPYINDSSVQLFDEIYGHQYSKNVSDDYKKMDDETQAKFQSKRIMLLSLLTKVLVNSGFLITSGAGVVFKEKLYFYKTFPSMAYKSGKEKLKNLFNTDSSKVSNNSNVINELAREDLDCEPTTCKAKGRSIVHEILKSFDQQLWLSAPVVATQNEFSGFTSIGVVAESGINKKGFGGSMGVGFSFGYNSKSKALVFEITLDSDKFDRAYTPFFTTGISTKAGISINNYVPGSTVQVRKSETLYPPVAPAFSGKGPRGISMGINPSLTSFPPSPIGDVFAFVNKTTKRPILRMTFSHLNSYFVGVGSSVFEKEWGVPNVDQTVDGHTNKIIRMVQSLTNKCRSALDR